MTKSYIGDSVYADFDGYAIVLTTENGLPGDPSNTIVLEPDTYEGLLLYVNSLGDREQCTPTAERIAEAHRRAALAKDKP